MDVFYPLEWLSDLLVYNAIGLARDQALGQALHFFIYDSAKILILLISIIMVISMVRTFLPPEKIRDRLVRMPKIAAHLAAGATGIITPFCSCSAVPFFLGFVEAGVPLGVTLTFLIASPLINEVALVMLFGMFGWQIALLYVGTGIVIAIVSGLIIGKLDPAGLLQEFVVQNMNKGVPVAQPECMTWKERLEFSWNYTRDILGKVWPWILAGVGIGAWIHGYVPVDFLAQWAGKDSWFAVPLATLVGVPLYSNAAGVLPLIGALTEKGMSIGTALAFMMAVTALSLPEFLILRRVMKIKLIFLFAGIVSIGIIVTGYVFNAVLGTT